MSSSTLACNLLEEQEERPDVEKLQRRSSLFSEELRQRL
jgi:hypothetical protein